MNGRRYIHTVILFALLTAVGCGGGDDGQPQSPAPGPSPPDQPPTFANAVLDAYVKASNPGGGARPVGPEGVGRSGDTFGSRLAFDGDTFAVSAPQEASCGIGINGDQTNNDCPGAGAVYIFTRNADRWIQQAYLKASNTAAGDFFGSSIALKGDTLAVSAGGEDSCARGINGDQSDNGCSDAGAVYVFTRTTGVWRQEAYVKASNTGVSHGFASVALHGDTLAVGAAGEGSCATGINGNQFDNNCVGVGAVYVFTRFNGIWTQQAYIKPSTVVSRDLAMLFGSPVALDRDTLAVGAINEGSCATGVNGDETNTGCFASGAVYVFTRSNDVWSQQAYVKASNTQFSDVFGSAVALHGDTLAVGAGGESSCARGINGDQADNGCPNAGAVYVFTRMTGAWRQEAYVKASNTDAIDTFGAGSLALSEDTLSAGAPREGSCATSINGVQADNDCPIAGAVYVFVRTNDTWSQQAYVKASNTEAGDDFGNSVAMSESTLAIGAPGESSCASGINGNQGDNNCQGAGAAYIYRAR